jgi:hypothetical protein
MDANNSLKLELDAIVSTERNHKKLTSRSQILEKHALILRALRKHHQSELWLESPYIIPIMSALADIPLICNMEQVLKSKSKMVHTKLKTYLAAKARGFQPEQRFSLRKKLEAQARLKQHADISSAVEFAE